MAKKTREELEELELRALEEAVREMNKYYDDDSEDAFPFGAFINAATRTAPAESAAAPADEAPAAEAPAEAPAEKPKSTRSTAKKPAAKKPAAKKPAAKKPAAKKPAAKDPAGQEPAKKPAARKPRKKAFVPNFVIQNSADNGITYESVVEKVQAAITAADVSSIDIYVKAEEGKAYYVVNGEAAGSVDLF